VSLGTSGTIAGFVRIIQLWLNRARRRSLTISVRDASGEKLLSIEGNNISVDTLTNALNTAAALRDGRGD
jgi:hypothetical protein